MFYFNNGAYDTNINMFYKDVKPDPNNDNIFDLNYIDSHNDNVKECMKIINEIFEDVLGENKDELLKCISNNFYGYIDCPSVLLLYGDGNNGKTTIINIIRNLFLTNAKIQSLNNFIKEHNITLPTSNNVLQSDNKIHSIYPLNQFSYSYNNIALVECNIDDDVIKLYQDNNKLKFYKCSKSFNNSNENYLILSNFSNEIKSMAMFHILVTTYNYNMRFTMTKSARNIKKP